MLPGDMVSDSRSSRRMASEGKPQAARRCGKADEHEHEGMACGQQAGIAQALPVAPAAMQTDQRGGDQPQGKQQPESGGDALRIEVMGEQQEVAEHDDDHRIALRFEFEQLHRHEHHQHAGIAPEQGAELEPMPVQPTSASRTEPSARAGVRLPPQADAQNISSPASALSQ